MEYRSVLTTCPYCGCGCNMFLQVVDGHLVGTLPCKTHEISRGSLCIKGWNAHEWVEPWRKRGDALSQRGDADATVPGPVAGVT